jgi:tetratricopeptide (TPR) repeat protein
MAWHYRAQISEAIGETDQARDCYDRCRQACAATPEDPRAAGWVAYAKAHLARLEARAHPPTRSTGELAAQARAARIDARAAHWSTPTITPIVEVLCADTLTDLARADPAYAREAARIAEASLDAARGGPARPQIAALTALARAQHALGQTDAAEQHAARATALLEELGGVLPALRSEEVWATAALTAHSAGNRERAARMLDRAESAVSYKRGALADAGAHAVFDIEPVNMLIRRLRPMI